MKLVWQSFLLIFSGCCVESLKTRDTKLRANECPDDDADWWTQSTWRQLGAYSEEDCDNDGVMDRICDTHDLFVESEFQNKRWILLSSDCGAFNKPKGDAPPCKDIKETLALTAKIAKAEPRKANASASERFNSTGPSEVGLAGAKEARDKGASPVHAIDVAYKAAKAAALAGGLDNAEVVASRAAAKAAEILSEETTRAPTTTKSTTQAAEKEKCASVGESVCEDDEVFLPHASCAGETRLSCTSTTCCARKARCSSSLLTATTKPLCNSQQVLIKDAFCADTDQSSCTEDLCCAEKMKCAAASPQLCHGKGELSVGELCAGADPHTCEVEACCHLYPKCSSVASMCDDDSVFAPENFCLEGQCDSDACCLPKVGCVAAESELDCPPGSKFHAESHCDGSSLDSCSTETCCARLRSCENDFDRDDCDSESAVFAKSAFCQDECTASECCLGREKCSSLESSPCHEHQRFVPGNFCSGSDSESCGPEACCESDSE